ncbi:MAG: hypothetical protein R3F54_04935 [Alphaproteobacteria bacterium]
MSEKNRFGCAMVQAADIQGSNNNTVQIIGDGNSVTLRGAAALKITRYAEGSTRARVRRDFDLLKPYTRSIELIGRETEQRSLRDWLETGETLIVRVMTGQGGSGKTRLALDLCDHLPSEDWQAGFADGDDLKTFCNDATSLDWAWTKPTLVVVDYAATFGDTIHRWLGHLADHAPADAPTLRILLLERQADPQAGWWRTIFGGGKARDDAISDLLDPEEPIDIQPLAAPALRRQIFLAALERTAKELDKDPPHVEHSEAFDNRLADLTWGGRPLFLMMAAMLAASEGVPDVLALSRIDLAMRLAQRELKRIDAAAKEQGLDPTSLQTLTGYVTLCQGLEREPLIEAIGIVQQALHRSGDVGPIADLLRDQLPAPDGGAAAIMPEIIGEAVMLIALDRHEIGSELALRAFQQTANRAVASIIRTAQDYVGQTIGGRTIIEPLAWLYRLILGEDVTIDQLAIVSSEITDVLIKYHTSLALMDANRLVIEAIVERLEAFPDQDGNILFELARNKTNLATALSELGRQKEGLLVAIDATDLCCRLEIAQPGCLQGRLAISYNTLANRLAACGYDAVALRVAKEVLQIDMRHAAVDPEAFRPNVARSVQNLSNRLFAVGQKNAAADGARLAVSHYRELVSERPDEFEADLGISLCSASAMLSEIGSPDEGLIAATEAVELFVKLSAELPDAFLRYLAISLGAKADCLEKLERKNEALASNIEAISMLKGSFLRHPPNLIRWMKPLYEKYTQRCGKLGETPDLELLGPIVETIQNMEKE